MATLLFENALVFDGHQPELLADQHVLVDGERIVHLGGERPRRKPDRTLDLRGRVLMPGLIDAHFHAYAATANFRNLEQLPHTYVAQRARPLMEAALQRGFTTVRDAGGADYGLWRAVEEGLVRGPRLFYCGRALSQTGGHADVRPPHLLPEPCGCSQLHGVLGLVVDGADAVRKAVRETLRQGAHQIKLMVSGGISSPSDPIWMMQFSEEEIRAAVDEAARRRSYVMAHAYAADAIARAVRCGVRSIEHGNLIDADAAALMTERGAWMVPTLVTYEATEKYGADLGVARTTLDKLTEVKDQGLQAVELCRRAGVQLGLGTDLLGDMHPHQLRELAIRAQVETPFQVLHSATAVNAAILMRDGELGCVAEGALADLIVVDGNPLEDLAVLHSRPGPDYVFKGGAQMRGPA